MAPNIRMAPATLSDIPTLGRLFASAFAPDNLRHFIFAHGYDHNLSIQYSQARYGSAYEDPSKRFLKAVDDTTGNIVGFIMWSVIEEQGDESEMDTPPPLNSEFNHAVFGRFQKRRVEMMRGKRYIRKLPSTSFCVALFSGKLADGLCKILIL